MHDIITINLHKQSNLVGNIKNLTIIVILVAINFDKT